MKYIYTLSKAKIGDNFPELQILVEGFSTPYRLNHTAKDGGILQYIRNNIPS